MSSSLPSSPPKAHRVVPRKRWGQHFLRSPRIAHRIVQLLVAQPGDTVVEIGPGTGALTEHLLRLPIQLVAIELDPRCIDVLHERFPPSEFPHLELFQGDILSYDIAALARRTVVETGRKPLVIGNVPYNISSPLLFRLFETAPLLARAVLMLQREVALRLTASPGTKDYGILRLACWAVAEARLAFHVPPTAFVPPPAVDSSVVVLTFRPNPLTGPDYAGFCEFLHAAFGQRRKQLHNALRRYVAARYPDTTPEELLQRAGIAPQCRAEELAPAELLHLYSTLSSHHAHVCA